MTRQPVSRVTQRRKAQQFRGGLYALREHGRQRGEGYEPPQRIRDCGRVRHDDHVAIARRSDGAAGYRGVVTCSSVWECPVCRARVCSERAEQIARAVARWHAEHGECAPGEHRVLMLTLTIRHRRGERLSELGGALIDARRRMWQGATWSRWRARWGAQYIAGWETTYGDSAGWHPHIHVLLMLERPMTAADVAAQERWLLGRWRRVVAEVVDGVPGWSPGDPDTPHMPDCYVGAVLSPTSASAYVAKLGLELQDPGCKTGCRRPQRPTEADEDRRRYTPLELLQAHMDGERSDGLELWREYCTAMRGRRQLTWSHGLRDLRSAILEEQEREREDEAAAASVVGGLDAAAWDEMRDLDVSIMRDASDAHPVMVMTRRWDGRVMRVAELRSHEHREAIAAAATTDARCVVLTCAEMCPSALDSLVGCILDGRPGGAAAAMCATWRAYYDDR